MTTIQTKNLTEAGQDYAAAYAAHYSDHDLQKAIELYKNIMAAYPASQEAAYSQQQVRNIVKKVIPLQELIDVELDMALVRLKQKDQTPGT